MIAAMRPGDPAGNVRATEYFVRIEPGSPGRRRLSWTPERTEDVFYHVLMDAVFIDRTQDLFLTLNRGFLNPRAAIDVIETSTQNEEESLLHVATQPDNRVRCTWDPVDRALRYELFRKVVGEAYSLIYRKDAGPSSFEFLDGPLEDGSYVYKLVSYDLGDDTTEDEEPAAISSPPQRPTNIAGLWTPGTSIFRISWTASVSPDIKHYSIRHNSGSGPVRIDDAPEDTTTDLTWDINLTAQTGDYEFLVRAVDNDDQEEQNVSNMLSISVVNGVVQGVPADPDNLFGEAIAGGKARISYTYFPAKETGGFAGPSAKEGRVYYDAGTGIIDWDNPIGIVTMDFPTAPASYSFDTDPLANDTYLFGVRIASDTGGLGIETTNTNTVQVTTDDLLPGPTDLNVAVT